jgi:hypothetical protein
MTITVVPEQFQFVAFDSDLIRRVAERFVSALRIDRPVHIEVDETTPLARVRLDLGDTITVRAESGAFEDTKRPRRQSETTTATSLGRVLLRAHDRLAGGFGDAPDEGTLSLAQVAAWDTYCAGRLERLGVSVNQQRWRYNFRNRHGFSDVGDAAFDRIWASDALTWESLDEWSRRAGAPQVTA